MTTYSSHETHSFTESELPEPQLYAVSGTIQDESADGWGKYRALPTFYLDGNVQGFTTRQGAELIADMILNPDGGNRICFMVTKV